jgi:hypothetical protein
MKRKNLLITIPALAVCTTTASAAIVVGDFESLSDGNIDAQSGWRVTPVSDWTANVVSGGLSYSNGSVSVNGGSKALRVDGSTPLVPNVDPSTDFVGVNFSFAPSGSTTYFSFLLELEDPADDAYDGFINIGFSGANTSADTGDDLTDDWSRISAGALALRGGNDQVRGWNSSGSRADSGNAMASDEFSGTATYLVVGRVVFNGGGNEAISFSYNPNTLTEGDANWVTVNQELGVNSLNYFGIYLNDSEPNANNPFVIDNIMVGDSYDAVVVPEPTTFAFLSGLLALGVVYWRRRR